MVPVPVILVLRGWEINHGEICPGSELLHQPVQCFKAPGDGEERGRRDVSHFIYRLQGAGRHFALCVVSLAGLAVGVWLKI